MPGVIRQNPLEKSMSPIRGSFLRNLRKFSLKISTISAGRLGPEIWAVTIKLGQSHNRLFSGRGSSFMASMTAPAIWPDVKASTSASSSTMAPLQMLIR